MFRTPAISLRLYLAIALAALSACGDASSAAGSASTSDSDRPTWDAAAQSERLISAWRAGQRAIGELVAEDGGEALVISFGRALVQRAWLQARPGLTLDPNAPGDEPGRLVHLLAGQAGARVVSHWTPEENGWALAGLELPWQGLEERLVGAWSGGLVSGVAPFLADTDEVQDLGAALAERGWERLPPLGARRVETTESGPSIIGEGPLGTVRLGLRSDGPAWLLSWELPEADGQR